MGTVHRISSCPGGEYFALNNSCLKKHRFIERHNLIIRQGCSYLGRRTPCHARRTEFLEGQVALLMAYYNFLRPHRALKFGTTIRTPAMQAGLANPDYARTVVRC